MNKIRKMKGFEMVLLFCVLTIVMVFSTQYIVFAAGDGDELWNAIVKFLITWVKRLGGAIAIIGAITFGYSVSKDDADGKTLGIRMLLSGCIIFAVGLSSDILGFLDAGV